MSFDKRCWDLAAVFLEDHPNLGSEHTDQLAEAIQECIEDYLETAEWCGSMLTSLEAETTKLKDT